MIEFAATNIWPRLKAAARACRQPADIAVAYFGRSGNKLLPLSRGSRLVVDAGEDAVKQGRTCPAALKRLVRRGVRVYSASNLHAKVFVFGRTAFIGSANASDHSANTLLEAAAVTTDGRTVQAARDFVRGLCLQELGPEELERRQKLYRPPRFGGGRRKRGTGRNGGVVRPALPRVLLVHLFNDSLPEGSEQAYESGRKTARKLQERPRLHQLQDFHHAGPCPYRAGDIVVQVVDEGDGRLMVEPPGNVIHTRTWRRGARKCTFVYLELPCQKRIAFDRLAKRVGRGAKKRLWRGGRLGREFAQRLLAAWNP